MEKSRSYFAPNFLLNRSKQSRMVITVIQFLIVILLLQFQSNNLIPRPSGIVPEGLVVVEAPDFMQNFWTTVFFLLRGMGTATLISLFFCYIYKIDALGGFSVLISKLRYLTYAGFVFVLTMMLHDNGAIKFWVLVCGIVPYFVTSLLSYIDEIPPEEYQLCYTLKMKRWEVLYEVIIRGKLHLALEVVRQNFAIGWMMISSLEILCWSAGGLGTLLSTEGRHFRMDRVFAILGIILGVAWIFDYLFGVIGVWIFPYRNPNRARLLWINRLGRLITNKNKFPKLAKTTSK